MAHRISGMWAAPALLTALGLLVYAVGKAYYATQGRLGIPGGQHVPAAAAVLQLDAAVPEVTSQPVAPIPMAPDAPRPPGRTGLN